jgi:hypothetical protein
MSQKVIMSANDTMKMWWLPSLRYCSRFCTGVQVSYYIGFVPRLDYSGTIQRNRSITKHGNGYLLDLLVQAAWSMVTYKRDSALKERYICLILYGSKGKKKTIVSIGRGLLELMYSVFRKKTVVKLVSGLEGGEYLTKLKEFKISA